MGEKGARVSAYRPKGGGVDPQAAKKKRTVSQGYTGWGAWVLLFATGLEKRKIGENE